MHTVALFSDQAMLPGTHATLVSLIINNDKAKSLRIILFGDKLKKADKELLHLTFKKHQKSNQLFEIRDAPRMFIPGANSLLGNYTAYGRLYLGDLISDSDHVIYLDCDLIIHNYDIIDLFDLIVSKETTISASGVGAMIWSHDKKLYQNANFNLNELCFNSGVLGINLRKWREENYFQKCLDVIKVFPNQFLSADQAVLNLVFHNNFSVLPENLNISASGSNKIDYTYGIYHFRGAPKPWDLFMNRYHRNYNLWHSYFIKSEMKSDSLSFVRFSVFLRSINSFKNLLLKS